MTTAVDQVHELNDPGSGSPEEGEYHGRERIKRLFERVYEGWEYMQPVPTEIREVEDGVFLIRGELRCKHTATENMIVEHYEQRLEIRDGLMTKGRMTIGTASHG